MAKNREDKIMAKGKSINVALLAAIAAAEQSGTFYYVSKVDGEPLMQHDPNLIEVDFNNKNEQGVAAKLSVAGKELLMSSQNAANTATQAASAPAPSYSVIGGAVLPQSKRGNKGGGAPIKYPFDNLEIGQMFFVPVSVKHKDPVKTLGSTVSSANMRYAVDTGQKRTVERTKRGSKNKAVLDAQGNKVKETVEIPVYRHTRKFTIRPVEAGKKYGEWTAPENGAMIMRVELPSNDGAEAG